ncbi:hypothetical protein C2G38_2037162 [Gigaspora rosea]|uniref:Uncharacterized protein n=1 Tax=Gigaspora rosea TaxID=44941 RepID=A0A397VFM6_9GLOM|nr:hypothetical protein C2G38_2037162 [Gigaspora rosea]CAG8468183.1 22602_t:CDS:1 [Gigaspora rosea]
MSNITKSTRPVTRAYAAQHRIKIDPLPPASYHPEPSRRRSQNRNNNRINLNSTQRRQSTRRQRSSSSQQSRHRSQQRKTTPTQIKEESSSPQQQKLEIRHRQSTPFYIREESSHQISSPQYLQTVPESESPPYRLHENGPIITSATGVSHDSWFNYYDSPDLTGQNPEEFDSYSSDTTQPQLPDFLSMSTQPAREEEGIEIEFQQEQSMRRSVEPSELVRYNAFYYEDDYSQQMIQSQRRQPVSAITDIDGSLIRNSMSYSQTDNVRRNRHQNNSHQSNGIISI